MLKQWVRTILIIQFLVSVALAQNAENLVVAPIITAGEQSAEAIIGALVAEAKKGDPNALDLIRAELTKMQQAHQAKAKKDGVFISTTYRLTPETLTFFAAIGIVTVNSMWLRSHGDPLAMEKHIMSLKDPIAHMSFYAFMLTNGFYMDFRTGGAAFKSMHPKDHARMMRRFNYQGMALGSLASSIAADLGQSGKMCVNSWILGKTDEKSIQSCNEAWTGWTARNKFTQYFPQIISMWGSQAVSDVFDHSTRMGFRKLTTTEAAKRFLNKEWLVKQAYKVTGADVALTFAGGTWAIKGIRWIGNVTKFTLFVGIDHILSPYIFRPMNNLIRPAFFDFDAYAINKFWKAYDDGDWEESKIVMPKTECGNPAVAVPVIGVVLQFVYKPNCDQSTLEKEIENYSVQVQQWRDHLNADVENDLAGWMELTKELLNQIDYTYRFYRTFSMTLFDTLNAGHHIVQNPEDWKIMNTTSGYPFRTLPLYGVSFGTEKAMGGADSDIYLNRPYETETLQKVHIAEVLKNLKPPKDPLTGAALEKYNSVLLKLSATDINVIAAGINDMNQILSVVQIASKENSYGQYANSKLFEALITVRDLLGNPLPTVYPLAGFAQAFTVNGIMKKIADDSDFSLWSASKKFKFNKPADLLIYKLICGNKLASFDKTKVVLTNLDALAPQFDAPNLLNENADRGTFCEQLRTSADLYTTPINQKSMSDFLIKNLDYKIIGDFRDKTNTQPFDKWWTVSTKNAVAHEFKTFDGKFRELTNKAQANMFNDRSLDKRAADILNQSKYLQNSLVSQFQTETELYLQLIQRALTPQGDKNLQKLNANPNYLMATVKSSKNKSYKALYGRTYIELQKLSGLMNTFYLLMQQEKVDFKSYIIHSKKIDTAVNDVLVAAGLKVVASAAKNEDAKKESEEEDIMGTMGSEASDTDYKDVEIKSPTLRQRVIIASVKGLRQVESETRRFIRMKVMLSQALEIDAEEFRKDYENDVGVKSQKQKSVNPRGGG